MATVSNSIPLAELLHSVFGFARFRANQEEVCRAAIEGRDLLLVMPTGAGKSLCYQLPAIARGSTALVISPLIALMEDQAAKLASLGLRVARIHSGLDRAQSRQACVDYLRGDLQFLFIAPERLRVPGFAEMLAKKQLALIAIDEAHCISQWGHDFRPDYRMLGQHLPALRGADEPAPVLALTATATPTVQADIITQLGMVRPARFIHGFRRDNLAIEVVEVPVPQRAGTILNLLTDRERRPAIVYATSRKQAEQLAEGLSRKVRAAAYHAGLDAEIRERVQRAFQAGELDVVVATIAFGMGIDKADIRTVIHAGLPGTLEGYYQEIGRAGRDGALSRTYLMHSFADQRTHGFFLSRDYPPVEHLEQVFRSLGEEAAPVDELREVSRLSEEEFEKALDKLEIHGGARVDFGGGVKRGASGWKKTYATQAQHRAEQFEKVVRYTNASECRMAALVRHFGDEEDASQACGKCDVCDPSGAVLRQFRRATAEERGLVQQMIEELRSVDYKAAGTLQRSLDPHGRMSRDEFDALLDAVVRAGLIMLEDAEYEKDGEVRRFRKVRLTTRGLEARATISLELLISDGVVEEFGTRSEPTARAKKSKTAAKSAKTDAAPVKLTADQEALAARLKEWRAAEAKKLGVPAYVVMHDRTLTAIAAARPANPRRLLDLDGMGPAKVEKFGAAILSLCGASR
ncbi:MAG TPA: ATP-dependent DNA helicase RecQ [Terracidiphilus sp.]|nr:ATP-dependent DNA helicase RecQ [Terracidiphilus sp.]